MHKVSVSIPAVCTNVGPGYDVLGLALNMRNIIEMNLRHDDQLKVEIQGEGKGVLPENYYNPAVSAAIKLFQQVEQAPAGLNVICTNRIPLDVGLSARASMIVGGLVGANNLLGSPYRREDLIAMATELSGQPEAVVTAMRGGLGLASHSPNGIIYRTVETQPLRVVIALPALPDYEPRLRDDLPDTITMADAVHTIGHAVLLVEALRHGDFGLLHDAIEDRMVEPHRREFIPGYADVVRAAQHAGAAAMTLCGAGPALIAFSMFNHQSIETAIQDAFRSAGVTCQTWTLTVDLQGVVISVVE